MPQRLRLRISCAATQPTLILSSRLPWHGTSQASKLEILRKRGVFVERQTCLCSHAIHQTSSFLFRLAARIIIPTGHVNHGSARELSETLNAGHGRRLSRALPAARTTLGKEHLTRNYPSDRLLKPLGLTRDKGQPYIKKALRPAAAAKKAVSATQSLSICPACSLPRRSSFNLCPVLCVLRVAFFLIHKRRTTRHGGPLLRRCAWILGA